MKKIGFLLLGIMVFTGCYYDKADQLYPAPTNNSGCDTTTAAFAKDVLPVMISKCATSGCHNATTIQSGYDMSTYAGVKLAVDDGKLLGSIRQESGYSAMPKDGSKVDACSINKIARWVNLGAQNN